MALLRAAKYDTSIFIIHYPMSWIDPNCILFPFAEVWNEYAGLFSSIHTYSEVTRSTDYSGH